MDTNQLADVANRFVTGLPEEVAENLDDVELLVCDSPEHAASELELLFRDEGPDSPDTKVPADCKGLFIGDPMETEDGEGSEDEPDDVYLPEGVIVLCASTIKDAEEATLVLMHEMGHALGMSEDEVKSLGLGVEEAKANVPTPAPNNP